MNFPNGWVLASNENMSGKNLILWLKPSEFGQIFDCPKIFQNCRYSPSALKNPQISFLYFLRAVLHRLKAWLCRNYQFICIKHDALWTVGAKKLETENITTIFQQKRSTECCRGGSEKSYTACTMGVEALALQEKSIDVTESQKMNSKNVFLNKQWKLCQLFAVEISVAPHQWFLLAQCYIASE